ncbi:MAG: hypothetical protein IJ991_11255, partial [Thermoguttaceae bacterium]|nr:hypothetical protein [Thermoguttaceae bacterium]
MAAFGKSGEGERFLLFGENGEDGRLAAIGKDGGDGRFAAIEGAGENRGTTQVERTLRTAENGFFGGFRLTSGGKTLHLAELRGKFEAEVSDYNKLKPEVRAAKVNEDELKQKVSQVNQEKMVLEEQLTKLKSRVEEQSGEITSLKDEVSTAKDETAVAKEECAALEKKVQQLQKLMQQMAQQQSQSAGAPVAGGASAVTSLPAGNKGKVADVNNKLMFCVIEFSDEAMDQMIGSARKNALPALTLGVLRKGFKGAAGEFVGKVRLRQSVAGK